MPSARCTRSSSRAEAPTPCSPPTPRASRSRQLADGLADPGRLVGLHFFNPVAQMPLVEVIHSAQTRPEAAGRGRGLRAPARQAAAALPQRRPASWSIACCFPTCTRRCTRPAKACRSQLIDRAAVDFGMPMGPIELADVVGLDVVHARRRDHHARARARAAAVRAAPARAGRGAQARPQERPGVLHLAGRQGRARADRRHRRRRT